jgi:hypothetical protein
VANKIWYWPTKFGTGQQNVVVAKKCGSGQHNVTAPEDGAETPKNVAAFVI